MNIAVIYVLLAVLLTAGGQLLYKLYFIKKKWLYLVGAVLTFVLVPFFNYLALKTLSLDVVYMAAALTIIMVVLASVFMLNEQLSKRQIVGTLIITAGIIIYNLNY